MKGKKGEELLEESKAFGECRNVNRYNLPKNKIRITKLNGSRKYFWLRGYMAVFSWRAHTVYWGSLKHPWIKRESVVVCMESGAVPWERIMIMIMIVIGGREGGLTLLLAIKVWNFFNVPPPSNPARPLLVPPLTNWKANGQNVAQDDPSKRRRENIVLHLPTYLLPGISCFSWYR